MFYTLNGIVFQQATEVFFDPFLVLVDGSRNDEDRDAVIGFDQNWRLLFVVYIEREDEIIRIISARQATRQERELYEV
ncbi:BrnT family toxin [Picosynechococcus sp. PCC 7117]|uniref:BrnT family toxin n=1 Tax=Picosynechococcus sp. PCC 7117 TaxID=195498 RepID=UPI000A01E2F4|nr:BrnT family toxin [Picosynechococcus sp. PCC 7117]